VVETKMQAPSADWLRWGARRSENDFGEIESQYFHTSGTSVLFSMSLFHGYFRSKATRRAIGTFVARETGKEIAEACL
jgi:hypothetical protein